MKKKLSPRPTTALIVAILALVVALSSSATAALLITGGQIKNGTVTGKDVKNRSITGKDIKKKTISSKNLKKNAIKSKHVKDHSLTGNDVRFGSLTGEHITDGSITLSDVSKNLVETLGGGASGFEVVTVTSAEAPMLGDASVTGSCPAGKVAISANAYWLGDNTTSPQLRRVSPSGFNAQGPNPLNIASRIELQVTCLSAS
jgi:hypothetical protein